MMEAAAPKSAGADAKGVETSRSISVLRKRWRKFRRLKRGWWSFQILLVTYLLTFLNPVLINNKALLVRFQGHSYFPVLGTFFEAEQFGQHRIGEPNYRKLKAEFKEAGNGDFVLLPPYPYHPNESLLTDLDLPGSPPHPPSREHWLGTDDRDRDVFARLVYGYRISITFALGVVFCSYLVGIAVGAMLGFFGGRVDIYGLRLVEIWATIPFLYTVMIISSLVKPGIGLLMVLLAMFGWIGLAFYIRGEFYREKARDYVAAAIAQGESDFSIMFRHILPNSLTPVISFAPFAIVGAISSLVALDVLGFGLPAPTPSWGELVTQGLNNIDKWHLVLFPLGALFVTLMIIVFVGEAIREAFDPKVFSRLR